MKNTQNNLYENLYKTLTEQMLSGTLLSGQEFPSQREICMQYNVGITTVRKVVKMLDEQGYIRTAQGQPSVVTYQASREARASFLIQRQEKIADLYQGLTLLMPVLYREGAKRCKEPELRLLREVMDTVSEHMSLSELYKQANAFLTQLIRPLNNRLILDLELDSEKFLQVPYIPFPGVEDPFALTAGRLKTWMKTAINQIEQKQYDALCDRSKLIFQESSRRVDEYLCALRKYTPDGPQTKDPIRWFRIKDRSELYSRLAMTIIRRIVAGDFDDKKYLPSIPVLMEEYGVMKNTARRAVTLLNSLGFAQTIDKKGTVLTNQKTSQTKSDFSLTDPIIQERLSLFLEALQIIALTAGSCAASITSVPENLGLSTEKRLRTAPKDRISPLSFQLIMHCYIQLIPHHSLKNIFNQLSDLLVWGHYLQAVDESLYPDNRKTVGAMEAVATALKNHRDNDIPDAFSRAFSLLYQDVCATVSQLPFDFKSVYRA